MISRLFLIGMVGALGVSLPEGAEWGSGLTWAQGELTVHVACCNTVAFEPIAIDEDAGNGIADELNRRSEGLEFPTVAVVSVVRRSREEVLPVPSGDSVELRLMAELCRIVEEAESRGAPADNVVDNLFAENRVWSEPTVDAIASSSSPAREPVPSFEPIVVTEAASSIADELNRASEGIDIEPAKTCAWAAEQPAVEPIAAADSASDVADERNRSSEDQSRAQDPDRNLGNALRLTRDAALAWVNVLTEATPDPSGSR